MTRIETFLDAAIWHGSLDRATALLAEDPELATANIFTAAVLGDEAAVRRFLAEDPANATARYGPFGGDALTYLCLSKYLRLEPARTPALLQTATALLDGGADAKSGFWTTGEHPEFETALYGAAGVAHHPEMTALLLARGADPNDDDSVYHSPETYDNRAMKLLVETGRLTPDNLAMMLIRKHDWHDYEGVKYLLEHGADPNLNWRGRSSALRHALLRDNALKIIALLLDHGADPALVRQGHSGVALAAREGAERRARTVRAARDSDRPRGRRSPDRRVRDGRCRERPRPRRRRAGAGGRTARHRGHAARQVLRHWESARRSSVARSRRRRARAVCRGRWLLGNPEGHAADPHRGASPADRCRAPADRTRIAGRHRGRERRHAVETRAARERWFGTGRKCGRRR